MLCSRLRAVLPSPRCAPVCFFMNPASACLQGVGVREMRAGQQPVIGVADTVKAPGVFTLEVGAGHTWYLSKLSRET